MVSKIDYDDSLLFMFELKDVFSLFDCFYLIFQDRKMFVKLK